MRVVALKNLLYKAGIREKGTSFDIDDGTYYIWKERGWVDDVKILDNEVLTEEEVEALTDGLPALDEKPTRKKKNGTADI